MGHIKIFTFSLLILLMAVFGIALGNDNVVVKDGVVISGHSNKAAPSQTFPATSANRAVVNAAVVDSQGTDYLSMTIWQELNTNWANYGNTQVVIDYTSLNKENITYAEIAATGADILIISCAGSYVHEYTMSEIAAITQYVQEGHGLIITYISMQKNNLNLAPLVGLSTSLTYGTNTFSPFSFTQLVPTHPVFVSVPNPCPSGITYMSTPGIYPGNPWPLTTGVQVGQALAMTGSYQKEGAIIANETSAYRSVFFSHYIENQSNGSNQNDRQTFYNAMVWTGEPSDSLFADVSTISEAVGGIVNFTLDAGVANAGRNYLMFANVTGTSPGFTPPPGLVTIPINWDIFTNLAISLTNTTIFQNFYAPLDVNGTGSAVFDTLGPFTGGAGMTVNFAFGLDLTLWDFASNPVSVTITP